MPKRPRNFSQAAKFVVDVATVRFDRSAATIIPLIFVGSMRRFLAPWC